MSTVYEYVNSHHESLVEQGIIGTSEPYSVYPDHTVLFLVFEPHGLAEIWRRIKAFFWLWPFSYWIPPGIGRAVHLRTRTTGERQHSTKEGAMRKDSWVTAGALGFILTAAWILASPGLCPADEAIKVGAVQPITGRFAFAGIHINDGLKDALMMANEQGGINGKKMEYIIEDGTYTTEAAVAAFKRIMTRDNPIIMYGESTGLGKAVAPEIKERYKILYSSTSFSGELADPAANPYVFVPGPTYSDMFGVLLKHIAAEKPKAKVAFFYSDTEFGKDPVPYGREMCKKLGSFPPPSSRG